MWIRTLAAFSVLGSMLAACKAGPPSGADYSTDANYIGKSYVVTKDQAFMGIRDSLADGQTVTVVNTYRTPGGLLLVKVVDHSGKVLFDTPYAFSDLGLVDEIGDPVQKNIDADKVRAGVLGKQHHGYGNMLFEEDYSYTSTVENTRLDGLVSHGEYRREGLGAMCSGGRVFLTVSQSDIIAAPNSEVSYRIYVDRNQAYDVPATMTTYSALISTPPDELIQDLLQGREGTLRITTLTALRVLNFNLDGFAEMYTRVRNNCAS
ncbi:hypothetical protein [Pseudomonas sp. PL-6]